MHHLHIDHYAYGNSPIHQWDVRLKLIGFATFTVAVVSLPKHQIGEILPFFLLPAATIAFSGVPWRFLLRHILWMSPFVLMIALLNPLYESRWVKVGSMEISLGWIYALNIYLKFFLTMAILLCLVTTTPFGKLLKGLEWLKVPKILLWTLAFLYRYLFVAIEEAHRMVRSREARSFGKKLTLRWVFHSGGAMIRALFLRSLDRSQRIFWAMEARGFDGEIRLLQPLKTTWFDWIYFSLFTGAVILFWVGAAPWK